MAQQTDNPLDENGYPAYGTFRQPTKQQTAVEWLVEQMEKDSYQILFGKLNASIETIEQAKAMEKEQITQAHLLGLLSPIEIEATKQAEQYYDETYNN
jgi:hypothetical protein